jgi:hypothetical protein
MTIKAKTIMSAAPLLRGVAVSLLEENFEFMGVERFREQRNLILR